MLECEKCGEDVPNKEFAMHCGAPDNSITRALWAGVSLHLFDFTSKNWQDFKPNVHR
jgi:hypothetical protein